MLATNNIVQVTATGFTGTFAAGSDYNISNDSNGPGPGAQSMVGTAMYLDAGNRDLHLDPLDNFARNAGTNLSTDPNSWFFNDIDRENRLGSWNIGADQN